MWLKYPVSNYVAVGRFSVMTNNTMQAPTKKMKKIEKQTKRRGKNTFMDSLCKKRPSYSLKIELKVGLIFIARRRGLSANTLLK